MQLQQRRKGAIFSSMHLSLQDCHSSVSQLFCTLQFSASKSTVAAAHFHLYIQDSYKILFSSKPQKLKSGFWSVTEQRLILHLHDATSTKHY